MRSLLFVPGDSIRKMSKALELGADALILDLEDSVPPDFKERARENVSAFLREAFPQRHRPRLFVRISPLGSPHAVDDVMAAVEGGVDGIMLPKAEGAPSIAQLSVKLDVAETHVGRTDGATSIMAIATETAAGIFALGTYAKSGKRLEALTWGGEDLSAAMGAETNHDEDGHYTAPYRLARSLTLFGAAAAGVTAIDAVYTRIDDLKGLQHETEMAKRDGFSAKLAIHPGQIPIINEVFTPDAASLAHARAVIAAFAAEPDKGVHILDGDMLDRPHLLRAERTLARAEAAGRLRRQSIAAKLHHGGGVAAEAEEK